MYDYCIFIKLLTYIIFRERAQQLLNDGHAYKCYCTEKRLELLRRDALRTRTIPRYDNKCRSLDEEEFKHNEGKKYCIRFKVNFNLTNIHIYNYYLMHKKRM